ncbi:plasma membrane ATPase 4 [Ceratobasidium sp. AG-Ba]|nr:plasma membrane ATPase 4 [Ceratobasidium sp. AG-Ba]
MRKYQCPQCPACFTSTQACSFHLLDMHEGAGPSRPGPNSSQFYCCHCGISKNTHQGIKQHVRKTAICNELQEKWLEHQIELAGMSPRSRRRANTPSSYSQDDGSGSDIIMHEQIQFREHTHEHQYEDIAGTSWHEDPMETGSANELEDEVIPSEYGGDERSEAGSQEEELDSDADMDNNMADIPSDEELIPPNPCPPRPPSNQSSNQSSVTIELSREPDQYGHIQYVQQYPIPTVGGSIRKATDREKSCGKYPDVGKLSDRHTVTTLVSKGVYFLFWIRRRRRRILA